MTPTSSDKKDNYFGRSVSVKGADLIVGAWGDSTEATKSGCVYFYRTSSDTKKFELLTKFFHPKKQSNAYFGFSVSVFNTLAVVGSHGDSSKGNLAGVYIF